MSELHRKLKMSHLPPAMPPHRGVAGVKKGPVLGKRDYTPVSWDQYFQRAVDVKVDADTFHVYESGSAGPVCFCLHGGGFSALSWAILSKLLTGLVACRCAAMDFRGHGDTKTVNDEDLSAETMASDVERVVEKLYGDLAEPLILIGHSMGGAIAVHVASRQKLAALAALVVIDVVEGTALESLSSMQSFLRGRPQRFTSLEHGIEYCVRSGQIRNLESARVSVIGQLKRVDTDETATSVLEHQSHTAGNEAIAEEDEDTETGAAQGREAVAAVAQSAHSDNATNSSSSAYAWRIDLSKTEKYWKGWFEGLSQKFLSCSASKMLLLAGVDRLDKDLTVGQMQGKFQMMVLPQSGHAVHEDHPDKVADVLATFLVRNRLTVATDNFKCTFPAC